MNLSKNEIVRLLADEQNEPALLKRADRIRKNMSEMPYTCAV